MAYRKTTDSGKTSTARGTGSLNGGIIETQIRMAGLEKLIKNNRDELAGVPAATKKANTQLASILQLYQQAALQQGIATRGRVQARGDKLVKAIVDERNRRVEPEGFTVGFLEQGWNPARPYARAQDIGSRRHVGRELRGFFVTEGGARVKPVKGGKDPRFAQFARGPREANGAFFGRDAAKDEGGRFLKPSVRDPRVLIKNPIPGYRYTEKGFKAFTSAGYLGPKGVQVYKDAYASFGLRFVSRAINVGVKPNLSGQTRGGNAPSDGRNRATPITRSR